MHQKLLLYSVRSISGFNDTVGITYCCRLRGVRDERMSNFVASLSVRHGLTLEEAEQSDSPQAQAFMEEYWSRDHTLHNENEIIWMSPTLPVRNRF